MLFEVEGCGLVGSAGAAGEEPQRWPASTPSSGVVGARPLIPASWGWRQDQEFTVILTDILS